MNGRLLKSGAYVAVLNFVFVFVDGARGALCDVFQHGQLTQEDFGLVFTLALSETIVGCRCLV